ncbi:acyl transferase [Flaviaesturariibacter aridisoli]|uniref:Acyl transferase n=1 Tax=Flaviaesturariibacter aridisoli TaxID=2545761 RepID=A0A4R4E112_9BACT|nr:acyl transferase [Flaviaesturariibacter aridisoli]
MFHLTEAGFGAAALDVFRFQHAHNPLYRRFCDLVRPDGVAAFGQIPFLPISFFKTERVVCGAFEPALVFESSGTTGAATSRHYVKDAALYDTAAFTAFERLYGPLKGLRILALLPSYLERGQSSLVHMVQRFMDRSSHPGSGFFLHDHEALAASLRAGEAAGERTLLIGVTYALLDFAAAHPMPLSHTIVMETGGMKGRRRELLRSEVHAALRQAFDLPAVHSEYGMTELLSQAYARAEGVFETPSWLRAFVAEEDDPAAWSSAPGRTGRLCVMDLANYYSCSFIATEDIARMQEGNRFEVLGRMDHTDVRGCSLLAL